jgi:hypothetical protein
LGKRGGFIKNRSNWQSLPEQRHVPTNASSSMIPSNSFARLPFLHVVGIPAGSPSYTALGNVPSLADQASTLLPRPQCFSAELHSRPSLPGLPSETVPSTPQRTPKRAEQRVIRGLVIASRLASSPTASPAEYAPPRTRLPACTVVVRDERRLRRKVRCAPLSVSTCVLANAPNPNPNPNPNPSIAA